MKDLEQGSDAWLTWRTGGIGASEAPIVMGVSPYTTRLQLWEKKTNRRKDNQANWATRRGNDLEPKARATYELLYQVEMKPTLAQHRDYPFIRASLDGYNEQLSRVLEIKCPGQRDHETALNGKIPDKYWPQLQHQLLVTGAKEAHYYSFDGENGTNVIIQPDLEYCEVLLKELIEFWRLVQTDTPPQPDPQKDYENIDDVKLQAYCEEWKRLKFDHEVSKKLLEEITDKIKSGLQVPRGIAYGLRFTKSSRKGNVDYSKIPQLEGINLEPYRKETSEMFTISPIKPKKNGT